VPKHYAVPADNNDDKHTNHCATDDHYSNAKHQHDFATGYNFASW
jgi:hypothetical protein